MTEEKLLFQYAGLAMVALIQDDTPRSPGQLADAAFNMAEWMLAEAYRRNRLRFNEFTYASVMEKHKVLTSDVYGGPKRGGK